MGTSVKPKKAIEKQRKANGGEEGATLSRFTTSAIYVDENEGLSYMWLL